MDNMFSSGVTALHQVQINYLQLHSSRLPSQLSIVKDLSLLMFKANLSLLFSCLLKEINLSIIPYASRL